MRDRESRGARLEVERADAATRNDVDADDRVHVALRDAAPLQRVLAGYTSGHGDRVALDRHVEPGGRPEHLAESVGERADPGVGLTRLLERTVHRIERVDHRGVGRRLVTSGGRLRPQRVVQARGSEQRAVVGEDVHERAVLRGAA